MATLIGVVDFLGGEKHNWCEGQKSSLGEFLLKLYFSSQSTGLKVEILHLKKYYRQKSVIYYYLKRILFGNNKKVADMVPKLAKKSFIKAEDWGNTLNWVIYIDCGVLRSIWKIILLFWRVQIPYRLKLYSKLRKKIELTLFTIRSQFHSRTRTRQYKN